MSYQFDSRVRYSEVGPERRLSLNALVNYFQDSSTFHSEEVGLGIEYLKKKSRVWVLSSWQIIIEQLPELTEEILVQTWPYDFKGFYGSRNFALLNSDGKRIAWANSLWIFMDVSSGRPAKIEKAQVEGYQLEEKLPMEYAPRKVLIPEESVKKEAFSVLKTHLDTNQHVNNGQYILMGQEYLPDGFKVSQVRAEYKKSALLHDKIVPTVHEEEHCITVALNDEEGKPYAVVEFSN